MAKLLALAALAGALISASPPQRSAEQVILDDMEVGAGGYFVNLDLVKKIVCVVGSGTFYGTGSYVDSHTILTAFHVVAHGACTIDGVPVETIYSDWGLDYAVLKTPTASKERFNVACGEAKRGEEYFAAGYPLGETFAIQRYTGTGSYEKGGQFKGEAIFRGMSVPGMSGSLVVDRDGTAVGILTAGNSTGEMLARPLSQTWICR